MSQGDPGPGDLLTRVQLPRLKVRSGCAVGTLLCPDCGHDGLRLAEAVRDRRSVSLRVYCDGCDTRPLQRELRFTLDDEQILVAWRPVEDRLTMPNAAPRCCPRPGHPPFTGRACPACVRERGRAHDATRPSAARRGYDADWRAFRADFLRRFPTCMVKGCGQPATEVHHIVALRAGGLRFDPTNLHAMCKPHHSEYTAREQSFGRGNGDRGVTTCARAPETARGVTRETPAGSGLLGNGELP